MNLPQIDETYRRTLMLKSNGYLTGKVEKEIEIGDKNLPWDMPIIRAFIEDIDIQEMTITSTNVGFTKTIRKLFR